VSYDSERAAAELAVAVARTSAARTEVNRAAYEAADLKNFDALTFNAWFTAYVAGNKNAMRVAEMRFRPQFLVAFNAWLATDPFTNLHAPQGPTYMPQYVQPELAQANLLDARADNYYSLGERAARTAVITVGGIVHRFADPGAETTIVTRPRHCSRSLTTPHGGAERGTHVPGSAGTRSSVAARSRGQDSVQRSQSPSRGVMRSHSASS